MLIVAFAVLGAGAPALADRSRIGEEGDVIEAGDCELELASARIRPRGAPRERAESAQLSCGVGFGAELVAVFERQRGTGSRESVREIEAKLGLLPRRGEAIGLTLAAAAAWQAEDGRPRRRAETAITAEASRQVGARWLVEAQIGTARSHVERRQRTLWALGAEFALVPEAVELRAEIGGDDRSRAQTLLALRHLFWPDHAALTLGVARRGGNDGERRAAVALTVEF